MRILGSFKTIRKRRLKIVALITMAGVIIYTDVEKVLDLFKIHRTSVNVRTTEPVRNALVTEMLTAPPAQDNLFVNMFDIQEERKQRIDDVCSQNKILKQATAWTTKLNIKDSYLFCPVPQVAWTSWRRLWFHTRNVTIPNGIPFDRVKDRLAGVRSLKYERDIQKYHDRKAFNFSFVFVRNPWERLASAYISKAIDTNYTRVFHAPCLWENMQPYKPDITFEQFLSCIASYSDEVHWIPQWRLCNVCRTKFSFIGHLETVDHDASHILQELNLDTSFPHYGASKAYSTKKVIVSLYHTIPAVLLEKLIEKYRFDFELHGYSKQPPGRHDVEIN